MSGSPPAVPGSRSSKSGVQVGLTVRAGRERTRMKKHGWLDRAWIPNIDGYCLTLLLNDGRVVTTSVRRGLDGMHALDGVGIGQIVGWARP